MEESQTSKGTTRFSDFKGASGIKDLEKLQGYNKDKRETQTERNKEELQEITSKMSWKVEENGVKENESLKKYINEDVLTSKSALNKEIERVGGYLQLAESENDGYIENDNFHVKLVSYIPILNNYKKDIDYVNEEYIRKSWEGRHVTGKSGIV